MNDLGSVVPLSIGFDQSFSSISPLYVARQGLFRGPYNLFFDRVYKVGASMLYLVFTWYGRYEMGLTF